MSRGVEIRVVDNSDLVKNAAAEQICAALEAVGIQAEGDVKDAMTEVWAETGTDIVDTGHGRDSITHRVAEDEGAVKSVYVGSSLEYLLYVHEGTGKYAEGGGGTPKSRWAYKDPATGKWRIGVPQKPRRFLKNTFEKFAKDYIEIIKEYLRGDG